MKLTDFSKCRREIFALYDKTESAIKEDVRILREWLLQSKHLPSKDIQDEFLELCLLKNKFSIEKCKKKIEMYCTLKADPHYDYVFERIPVPGKEPSFQTPLPLLTDDYKRLIIFRIYDVKNFEMATDLNCNSITRELLLRFDYNDGEVMIIDLRNVTASILSKFRMNVFSDATNLTLGGYSTRISAIHVLSKVGKTIFSTITPLLPKKLAARLHFHDDIESLQDFISPKFLPSDFGGQLKSLQEINDDWGKILEDNKIILKAFIQTKALERLRQDDGSKIEEMKGTFKKLNID